MLTIAIARLACYPLMKFSPGVRIVLGFSFFIFYEPLRNLLLDTSPILHYIFFNNLNSNTPFPYFGFFFIGTALGNWINNWRDKEFNSKPQFMKEMIKQFAIIGIILIIFGILSGLQLSSNEIARGRIQILNYHDDISLNGLPEFLVRSSMSWCFYSLGIELIIIALFFKIDLRHFKDDLKQIQVFNEDDLQSEHERKIKGLSIFGQYSLTIYLTHYLLILFFVDSLPIPFYLVAYCASVSLFYFIFWSWANKAKGKGTIEWLIQYTSSSILRVFDERLVKKK